MKKRVKADVQMVREYLNVIIPRERAERSEFIISSCAKRAHRA